MNCSLGEDMVRDHIKAITQNTERSKTNEKAIEQLQKVIESVHQIALSVASLAISQETQTKELGNMVSTLKDHEKDIDHIKEKMETKETVLRLHGRIDDLENKDGKKAEELIKQVRNVLIGIIVIGLAGAIWAIISN